MLSCGRLDRKLSVPTFKVAAQTAAAFNLGVRIYPIHANVMDPQFDIEWFRGFDIVLNALDNLGVAFEHSSPSIYY